MRRQVSRGSAGEYQADEQAGVARGISGISSVCPCHFYRDFFRLDVTRTSV